MECDSSSSAALQPGVGFGLLYKLIPLLFPINSFQFFTFSTSISLRIPSIHLFLGLPAGLFPNGF
jgi:hypothetical protein